MNTLKTKCTKRNLALLLNLDPSIRVFIERFVTLCNPESVFVFTGTAEEKKYIREKALTVGEEKRLCHPYHSVHFDGYTDQGRDKDSTRYLLRGKGQEMYLNGIPKTQGMQTVKQEFKNCMQGREMIIGFFSLGPLGSKLSIQCLQITDSFYVIHSEDILYRASYSEVLQKKTKLAQMFRFIHTAGEMENHISKNSDRRRIYIDVEERIVYSMNTQYAGNTVGLKKLALRLAIKKASRENWLAEHMFVVGIKGNKTKEKTYFAGAFPSACGKTSTAMLKGETIIGDDIAYLRNQDGVVTAVNVEKGIFGIIEDINPIHDPEIWNVLHSPKEEVIFSNVLVDDAKEPYWKGKGKIPPQSGINFSGKWFPGKTDEQGREIPAAHKNARFTINLSSLKNTDKELNNPQGVKIEGIIYGGRDSDTTLPVEEAFNWEHGIITKAASIESETTAATLGQEGIRKFNPMSNLDFLSIPVSLYIKNNLAFGKKLKKPAKIFSVNYFLKSKDGKYLNEMDDKHVWIKWMQLRVMGQVCAKKTPSGLIPLYADLKTLFANVVRKNYSEAQYNEQFTIRIPENISKIDRIINIYQKEVKRTPGVVFMMLKEQKKRFEEAQKKWGEYISPNSLTTHHDSK